MPNISLPDQSQWVIKVSSCLLLIVAWLALKTISSLLAFYRKQYPYFFERHYSIQSIKDAISYDRNPGSG